MCSMSTATLSHQHNIYVSRKNPSHPIPNPIHPIPVPALALILALIPIPIKKSPTVDSRGFSNLYCDKLD